MSRNEWKYVADVETDFSPNLPRLTCLESELNQVFLNLIIIAAHAIGDAIGDDVGGKGTIKISPRQQGN